MKLFLIPLLVLSWRSNAHVRYTPMPIVECSDVSGHVIQLRKMFRSTPRTQFATLQIVSKRPSYFLELFNASSLGEVQIDSANLEKVDEWAVGSRAAQALVFNDKAAYVTNRYSGEMEILGRDTSIMGVKIHLELDPTTSKFPGPERVDIDFDRCLPVK